MMPRLTRVGNYYCREDPPKARVWDDDKKGINNDVNDCNHVLVTDAEGGIRSSLKRTRSFSAKNLLKTKSLQNVSRKSSKKLVRSMSTYSNPYKKEFKAAESKTSLSAEMDPTYKVLKDALVIRSQSINSSRQSLRGSRRTSGSSNKSKTSLECTQGNEKSREVTNQNTIMKESSVSRSLSDSPTLFHQRVLKNQNKKLANGPVSCTSSDMKPLSIEIPIDAKKKEADEIEVYSESVRTLHQYKQSCDSNLETKSFGNNSPSGGSNASSKSVHFATDVRAMSETPYEIVKSHLSISNKKVVTEKASLIETNLDECTSSVAEINNSIKSNNLGKTHEESIPLNKRKTVYSTLYSPSSNQSFLGESEVSSKLDKTTLGGYKGTLMPQQANGRQLEANVDRNPERSGQSQSSSLSKSKIVASTDERNLEEKKITDSPVLEKIVQARAKKSKAVPYKWSEDQVECNCSHTNSNASKVHDYHSFTERKKDSGKYRRRAENTKYSKRYEYKETPIYSQYNDVNVNDKTTVIHANQKLSLLNLNSPANNQLSCQQVNQSTFTSKNVPNPTPLTSKYSKSANDLKQVNMSKSLSMPLSSKLILSGDFPGYQPPNADAIPFVDDSIPYVFDDPPLSLTPVSKIKSNLGLSDTSQSHGNSRPKTNKHHYTSQDQNSDRKPTTNSRETHLITIKIETDKSETNETKVLIHDNKIQDQNGNNKVLLIILWSAKSLRKIFLGQEVFLIIN